MPEPRRYRWDVSGQMDAERRFQALRGGVDMTEPEAKPPRTEKAGEEQSFSEGEAIIMGGDLRAIPPGEEKK